MGAEVRKGGNSKDFLDLENDGEGLAAKAEKKCDRGAAHDFPLASPSKGQFPPLPLIFSSLLSKIVTITNIP